jgi:hypothetical protein
MVLALHSGEARAQKNRVLAVLGYDLRTMSEN